MNVFANISNLPNDHYLNPSYEAFQGRSPLYYVAHFPEKIRMDAAFYSSFLEHINTKFQINDLAQTKRIWKFVQKSHEISWGQGKDLTVETLKRIEQAMEGAVKIRRGVHGVLEGEDKVASIIGYLLAQTDVLPPALFEKETLKCVLIKKDDELLRSCKEALEAALAAGLKKVQDKEVTDDTFNTFLFNVLGLFPYFYPSKGDTFQIPYKVGEEWQSLSFRVDGAFELTPTWFSSPLNAYGLVAEGGHSILTCRGTTYPGGGDSMASILSDCTPFMSVGHLPALKGRQAIEKWLEGKKNVQAVGISLGGATALHLSRYFSKHITHVHAYNPTGLYSWDWLGAGVTEVKYAIYSSENDLVSTMGFFPCGENVTIYRVLREEEKNFVVAHNTAPTGAERVIFIRTPPEYENSRLERIALTLLHIGLSPFIFFTLLSFYLVYRICESIYRLISFVVSKESEV